MQLGLKDFPMLASSTTIEEGDVGHNVHDHGSDDDHCNDDHGNGNTSNSDYLPTTPPPSPPEDIDGRKSSLTAPSSSNVIVLDSESDSEKVSASNTHHQFSAVQPKIEIPEDSGGAAPSRKRRPHGVDNGQASHDPSFHKKVYTSPEILKPLSPPGCTFSLSFTDHRFKSTWKKHLECELWIDELKNVSFSSTFNKLQSDSWKDALCLVHANAWDKWHIASDHISELKLSKGVAPQEPGVIAESVYDQLAPIIDSMPPAKVYGHSKHSK